MDDFLDTLIDTDDPKVKKDELGNLYTYNSDGSLEIDIKDPATLRELTGDMSINCIACVEGQYPATPINQHLLLMNVIPRCD